ncbi:MAG: hypothetical protein PW786_03230 [Arachidicoccus sp.]|nr:hypothetical protein [Arachidicoccus sp.]
MFDSSFEYFFIQKKGYENKDILSEYIYQFKTNFTRYIVIVEEYRYNVFVPKFYPSRFKNNKNRFNILTNDFITGRIIRTVMNIMLDLLKQFPTSSFAWIGVPTNTTNKKESTAYTQRFRIYKRVVINFFNKENWFHYEDYRTSGYILVNKCNTDIESYLNSIMIMFVNIYSDLEMPN